jgi:hypothetical protein
MRGQTVLLCLMIATYATRTRGQVISISDSLTKTQGTPDVNTRLWAIEIPPPGNGSGTGGGVSLTPSGLLVTLGSGLEARGVVSRCSLNGDFDVQVSYVLPPFPNWPAHNPYTLRLGAVDLSIIGFTDQFAEEGVQRNSSIDPLEPSEFYTTVFTSSLTQTPTSDRNGALRLVRQGASLFGYFLSGGSWVLINGMSGPTSTNPTRFNLDVYTSSTSAQGVTVLFKNFQVNRGAVSCPSVADRAAFWAKSLLAAGSPTPYFLGAKGYDYAQDSYADASEIATTGYSHCNGSAGCVGGTTASNLPGVDCAGLVLWSYNVAASAKTQYKDSNPIQYEGSDGQFLNNVSPTPLTVTELQPGDLLFFNYGDLPPGHASHVAMYVGSTPSHPNGEVIEAYVGIGVISSSCSVLATPPSCERETTDPVFPGQKFTFLGYRRPTQFPQVGVVIAAHSPVGLSVTDPDNFQIDAGTSIVTGREVLREVLGQLYYIEDTNSDDTVIAPRLKVGDYMIKVLPKPGFAPTDTYSLTVETAGGLLTLAKDVAISNIPAMGYGISSAGTGGAVVPFTPLTIRVKHRVSLRKPTIRVSMLSSVGFSVLSIDTSTLTFGRNGNESSLAFCEAVTEGDTRNDDHPGHLLCYFYTEKTGLAPGEAKAILEGRDFDGKLIKGSAKIFVVQEDVDDQSHE